MSGTKSYQVRAKRWARGWELHIAGIGVTQSRTLADAARMVRDYLELDGHADAGSAEISVIPELSGALGTKISTARADVNRAAEAQRSAAVKWRSAAAALHNSGMPVSDVAAVLGVTKARVSQLLDTRSRGAAPAAAAPAAAPAAPAAPARAARASRTTAASALAGSGKKSSIRSAASGRMIKTAAAKPAAPASAKKRARVPE